MAEFLEAALENAARGWAVVPLHEAIDKGCSCKAGDKCSAPAKHPRIREWQKRASTDAEQLREWWTDWPSAGVGIVTGSKSGGIVAIDVDPDHGGDDALHDLEAAYHALPDTVEILSGGGGRHLLFKAPPEQRLGNTAGELGDGLDVRAESGLIVVPPSVHASGRRYEWDVDHHPDDVPLAEIPGWLLALLTRSRAQTTVSTPQFIPEGQRNPALTRLAGWLRLAGLDVSAIRVALHEHNAKRCRPPLPTEEVDHIADSAAGWDEPPPWLTSPVDFIADPLLSPTARLVLLVLTGDADPDGTARPGYRRIATLTGLHQRAINPLLGELEEAGRLEILRRHRRFGNVYRVASASTSGSSPTQGGDL